LTHLIESKGLKPGDLSHLRFSRFETRRAFELFNLKPGGFQAIQLHSTCTAPHRVTQLLHLRQWVPVHHAVAVQVAFESENFETRISLYRLKSRVEETRRFNKLWVKLDSVLVQPSPTMLINTAL
jgi:hypothetical protein